LSDQADRRAGRDAVRLAVQQEQGRSGAEADDLAGQIRTARPTDGATAAERGEPTQPSRLDQGAARRLNLAADLDRRQCLDRAPCLLQEGHSDSSTLSLSGFVASKG
jgi:hypothetical protein